MAHALRITPVRRRFELGLGGVALVASLVAALVTSGSSGRAPESLDAAGLVLQPTDLPAGFRLERGEFVSNAAAAAKKGSVPKDYQRLGRVTGYDATYTRQSASGLFEIETSASIYRTGGGAGESLKLSYRSVDAINPEIKRLDLPRSPGSDARLYRSTVDQRGAKLDVYTVLWHQGGIYATLAGIGPAGTVRAYQVIKLAVAQATRIRQAAG